MDVVEISIKITAILACLTAIGVFAKKLWAGYHKFNDFVRKADVVLDIASYELQHNGGGSIKDAASQLPGLARQFQAHLEQAAIRDDRINALDAAVTNLAEALPVVARSTPHPDDID